MELKGYFRIIRENHKIFWFVTFSVILVAFAVFLARPVSFDSSLTINITRSSPQNTSDYKFDYFYRLQADEKFAETVVQWLQSPRTVAEIYSKAGIDPSQMSLKQLSRAFRSEKLSSQLVAVNFSTKDEATAAKISNSIVSTISENTESLNKKQNEDMWFSIVAQRPFIAKDALSPAVVLLGAFFTGIFVAFWAVLIYHYVK